jgi:hypothetical protein
MTEGIRFRPDEAWLVSGTVSEPVLTEVARRLAPQDAALAAFVERGILTQLVRVDDLDPGQRAVVQRTVLDVCGELLADPARLRAIVVPPGMDADRADGRVAAAERAVRQLADVAGRAGAPTA